MAYLATETMGSDGLPRVLVRSYQGVTMGTGTISHLWLTNALDDGFEDWSDPVRITTQADAERSTAGTSGSLAVVGEKMVIVFNMVDELMAFVGSVDEPGGLVRESLGGGCRDSRSYSCSQGWSCASCLPRPRRAWNGDGLPDVDGGWGMVATN